MFPNTPWKTLVSTLCCQSTTCRKGLGDPPSLGSAKEAPLRADPATVQELRSFTKTIPRPEEGFQVHKTGVLT